MIKCPKCGVLIEDENAFCPHCGNSLTLDQKKSSKPTAAGILLIIAASLSLVNGFFFLYMLFTSMSFSIYQSNGLLYLYFLICIIFNILTFALGLTGGIFSIKRTHFLIAVLGVSFIIATAGISILMFYISIPVLVLGILGAIFLGTSKMEFRKV